VTIALSGRTVNSNAEPTPMPEPNALQLLLALVDEAFDHSAWHGPTLRAALRGVTPRQAEWRPGPGRHTIRELTVHAAYWKYTAQRRLTGDTGRRFALQGRNFFEPDRSRSWKDDLHLLVDEHTRLRAAVAAYPASALGKPVDAKQQTAAYTIRGVAAHDLYHAGQIQLIRKLQEGT
jgi:hypothetical protein